MNQAMKSNVTLTSGASGGLDLSPNPKLDGDAVISEQGVFRLTMVADPVSLTFLGELMQIIELDIRTSYRRTALPGPLYQLHAFTCAGI